MYENDQIGDSPVDPAMTPVFQRFMGMYLTDAIQALGGWELKQSSYAPFILPHSSMF